MRFCYQDNLHETKGYILCFGVALQFYYQDNLHGAKGSKEGVKVCA